MGDCPGLLDSCVFRTADTRCSDKLNGVLRDGCLNRWAFLSVREARLVVEGWRQEYNEERPHGALNQITPAAYAAGVDQENREAA